MANVALQEKGRREFPPARNASARPCPKCSRPASGLAWIYYTNGPECWAQGHGVEGWVVACMHCRKQSDFLPTLMI